MGFIAFIFSLIKRLVTGTPGTETTNSYDANGNTTTNAYDISGRLTTTTDALNNVVSYGYNVEDLMTSLTYTKGGTSVPTIYTYNDQHRLVRTDQPGYDITNPTGVITNTTYTGYDANGNVTSRTDGAGVNIQYAFDNINRMITKTYPNLSTVSTSYDAVSNLINISDTNTSTANEFDSLNRLTKVTDYMYNPAMAIDYSYYNDGVRKTLSQSGSTVTYTYDKARRLKSIAIAGMPGNISGYDYNALGQRTKETLVNGATVTYTYDSTTRWLTLVSNSTSTSALISSFVYTHDKVGNRVTMAGYNGGSSGAFTYTYNANYRLITETLVSGGMTLQTDYYYDEPGNRTRMSKNSGETTLYAYNNANQCISWTNPSGVCFTDKYNGAGSLITETNTASGVMQEWGFDYEGHQTVYSTTGTSAAYKIDAMGRRISKTVNGTTEYYFYDGANVFYDIFGPNSYRVYITAGLVPAGRPRQCREPA
ncbi:MAG: RHS repeat protein [Planctomycetes bacterium]|nr:RHS repeat protein [Planctomycetota bacterium]